jgi:hypothetical protein
MRFHVLIGATLFGAHLVLTPFAADAQPLPPLAEAAVRAVTEDAAVEANGALAQLAEINQGSQSASSCPDRKESPKASRYQREVQRMNRALVLECMNHVPPGTAVLTQFRLEQSCSKDGSSGTIESTPASYELERTDNGIRLHKQLILEPPSGLPLTPAQRAEMLRTSQQCIPGFQERFANYGIDFDLKLAWRAPNTPASPSASIVRLFPHDSPMWEADAYYYPFLGSKPAPKRLAQYCEDMLHEIGHLLGLGDEYRGCAPRRKDVTGIKNAESNPRATMDTELATAQGEDAAEFYPRNIAQILSPLCKVDARLYLQNTRKLEQLLKAPVSDEVAESICHGAYSNLRTHSFSLLDFSGIVDPGAMKAYLCMEKNTPVLIAELARRVSDPDPAVSAAALDRLLDLRDEGSKLARHARAERHSKAGDYAEREPFKSKILACQERAPEYSVKEALSCLRATLALDAANGVSYDRLMIRILMNGWSSSEALALQAYEACLVHTGCSVALSADLLSSLPKKLQKKLGIVDAR